MALFCPAFTKKKSSNALIENYNHSLKNKKFGKEYPRKLSKAVDLIKEDAQERIDVVLASPDLYKSLYGKKITRESNDQSNKKKERKTNSVYKRGATLQKKTTKEHKENIIEEDFLNFDQEEVWWKPSGSTPNQNNKFTNCEMIEGINDDE